MLLSETSFPLQKRDNLETSSLHKKIDVAKEFFLTLNLIFVDMFFCNS